MQARYRTDYAGEFVVIETRWSAGKKQQQREFVANPIENHHISGRAACIGSDLDLGKFDFSRLQRHKGGLLGSKKLQTYGTGHIVKHMRLDFAVETNADNLVPLMANLYHENNIVYTSARACVANPEKFYLIPFNPKLFDIVTIAYLAAFDGHKEVFLLGYSRDTLSDSVDWFKQLVAVIDAYSGTRFHFVGEPTNLYPAWLDCANATAMTYREFISYCDV